jgi:hypothetical protein
VEFVKKLERSSACPALVAAIILALICSIFVPVETFAQKRQRDPLDQIVRELFQKSFDQSFCATGQKTSLGLWAISEDKSPVGPSATKRIYEEVLSRLLRLRPKCVDVIDSAGIGIIIDHLHKSGALDENGGNVLAALSEAHQNVHMIVFPDLYAQAGNILLTLRIVERVSAKTRALTSPLALPKQLTNDGSSDTALSLEPAIKAAADQLIQSAPDLKEIQTGGIFFEATDAQPPAGRFIQEQLLGALIERGTNALTNKTIKVRGISLEPANPDAVKANELDSRAVARNNNAYDLSGRYWIRPDALDLRISLTRPDGATVGWRGQIRLSDLKGMELRPKNPASLAPPLPKGAYAFQVTSPKGVAPTYKADDELQLMIRVGRDAWVYCFYIDSKGQVLPIFPVPPKMAGERSNKLEANKLVRLPDPAKDTFRFRFNADTLGEELVSCYAANRDIRSDLPPSLFPDQLSPVAFLTLDRLRQTFRDIKDAQVAESLVTVTVTR